MTHPDIERMEATGLRPGEVEAEPIPYLVRVQVCIDVPIEAEDEETAGVEALKAIKDACGRCHCDYVDGEVSEVVTG